MPFPGSQIHDTIGLAYFLHCYINLFRIAGLALIAMPVYHYWKHGKLRQKIVPAFFILFYALIFYFFNFIAQADKMFVQPSNKIFSSASVNKVSEKNLVIGVAIKGESKAFPIQFIGYHHQVMDTIGGTRVIVTYCTVCRSGRVFSPLINGRPEKFRLVGMDHFNAMFEDAGTGSWWRQENGEAIAGPLKGKLLDEIPSQQMTLKEWIAEHPETKILQPDSLFENDYEMLKGYDYGFTKNPLEYTDPESWQMKSWVVGVVAGDHEKAYDWNEIERVRMINDTIGFIPVLVLLEKDSFSFHTFGRIIDNQELFFQWNGSLQSITDSETSSVWNSRGECIEGSLKGKVLTPLPCYLEYWHSWKQFHPNTTTYQMN
ncbi:MAG: DUF3179 domain-containing (seleno)protein [Chitinophagales bacterium]